MLGLDERFVVFPKRHDNGRVEVLAVGPAAAVAELADWLAAGPPGARVEKVESEDIGDAADNNFSGFETG